MTIFRTFGITAKTVTQVGLVWIVKIAEQLGPLPIVVQDILKSRIAIVWKVIGRRIVLLVTVAIAIVQLQVDTFHPYPTPAITTPSERSATLHL